MTLQIIELSRPHLRVSKKRRLLAAIESYAECKIEDAGKGGSDPAIVPLIEANLEGSKRRLHALVSQLLGE